MAVNYHLTNLSNHPLKSVRLEFDGPTMPSREMERTDDRQIVAGYDKGNSGGRSHPRLSRRIQTRRSRTRTSPPTKARISFGPGHVSNYFAAIVQPDKTGLIDKVGIHCPNPDAVADDRVVALDFQTADIPLAPGSSVGSAAERLLRPQGTRSVRRRLFRRFPPRVQPIAHQLQQHVRNLCICPG